MTLYTDITRDLTVSLLREEMLAKEDSQYILALTQWYKTCNSHNPLSLTVQELYKRLKRAMINYPIESFLPKHPNNS